MKIPSRVLKLVKNINNHKKYTRLQFKLSKCHLDKVLICNHAGLLVKGKIGDSHRGGADALHDNFLALKGGGTMILRNVGNDLSIDKESFQRT